MSQFKFNPETNRVEEKAELDSPTDDGSMNDSNYHLWEEYTAAQKYLRSYAAAPDSIWPEGWFEESEMEFYRETNLLNDEVSEIHVRPRYSEPSTKCGSTLLEEFLNEVYILIYQKYPWQTDKNAEVKQLAKVDRLLQRVEAGLKQPADPLDAKRFSARDMMEAFDKGYLRGVDEVYEKEKGIPSTTLNRTQYLQSLGINLKDNDPA